MQWLEDYVSILFDRDQTLDIEQFARERGLDPEELQVIDGAILHDAVMRRLRNEFVRALPQIGDALLEKGQRGDVPAIRLMLSITKPETGKGKNDDPMETFREL